MSSETGSSAHASSVSLLHAPRMLLMPPTPLEGCVCCGTLVPCHTWKYWEIPEDRVQTPRVPEVLHRLQPSLGLLEWSQFSANQQWVSAEKPEKKKKCCKYPKQNFCNGCREGTKQLFLVWALWADHTRVIKQASYWVASIPASCLQARPLCSSATATAGPLPAAGRARLPFRALHSHFSLLSSLPE